MYCAYCAQELPDDALFCLRCGKPQRPGVNSAPTRGPALATIRTGINANLSFRVMRRWRSYIVEDIGPNRYELFMTLVDYVDPGKVLVARKITGNLEFEKEVIPPDHDY